MKMNVTDNLDCFLLLFSLIVPILGVIYFSLKGEGSLLTNIKKAIVSIFENIGSGL